MGAKTHVTTSLNHSWLRWTERSESRYDTKKSCFDFLEYDCFSIWRSETSVMFLFCWELLICVKPNHVCWFSVYKHTHGFGFECNLRLDAVYKVTFLPLLQMTRKTSKCSFCERGRVDSWTYPIVSRSVGNFFNDFHLTATTIKLPLRAFVPAWLRKTTSSTDSTSASPRQRPLLVGKT